MMTWLNLLLAVLAVGIAFWSILVRSTFASVIAFIVFGLFLTLVWSQLNGIDVALTEAAIGGGMTGVLLIVAATRLRPTEALMQAEYPKPVTRWLAAGVAGLVSLLLAIAVLTLPSPVPTLAPLVAQHIDSTGVGNPITAVLLAFRAMDTLLEAMVLLLALLGVWSLAADQHWGGRPGLAYTLQPNSILTYTARVLPPLGIMAGLYIFWVGADAPGGKFQGATLLASMWLLVLIAGLSEAPPLKRRWLRVWLVLGPLVFIGVGWLGTLLAGAFLAYPPGMAKPLIVAIELALLPSLTLILGLLMLGIPRRSVSP